MFLCLPKKNITFGMLPKVLPFGNPQASLVFRSLNRTFAYNETIFADYTTPFGCHFHCLHGTWRL